MNAESGDTSVGIAQPSRNIPHPVEYAPHVNMIVALYIEQQMRVALQRSAVQPRQVEFMGIAG